MNGLKFSPVTVFAFIFLVSNVDGDAVQKKLEAQKRLALHREHERIVTTLKLTPKHVRDLTDAFGSKDAGLTFARDAFDHITQIRKDVLPSGQSILKQIIYAYYRGFMIIWRIIPSDVKTAIVGFVTESPMLMSLFKKLAPYLPGMAFDALTATLGLGGILG